ncbi:MAG TPA: hypothetical protein VGO55_14010 [Allosphingosinicella sp.]|nr:hypothetical protein [Allosphingosinicella sp.]
MKAPIAFALLAAATAPAAAAPAAAQRQRPVMIGTPRGDVGCWVMGDLTGLDPPRRNYVPVRAAPNLRARELDRVGALERIYFCEYTSDERWVGIVYPHRETPDEDCGLDVPAHPRRAYAGPCLSGWVPARNTEEYGD